MASIFGPQRPRQVQIQPYPNSSMPGGNTVGPMRPPGGAPSPMPSSPWDSMYSRLRRPMNPRTAFDNTTPRPPMPGPGGSGMWGSAPRPPAPPPPTMPPPPAPPPTAGGPVPPPPAGGGTNTSGPSGNIFDLGFSGLDPDTKKRLIEAYTKRTGKSAEYANWAVNDNAIAGAGRPSYMRM